MIDRKEALIGVGVAAGAALLVLFLKKGNSGTTDASGGIAPTYSTSGTVYVPTASYDIQYNHYKGPVSNSTVTTTTGTQTTTTYGAPVGGGLPIPHPPTSTSTGTKPINPPTKQTNTHPSAPPAHHPTKRPGTKRADLVRIENTKGNILDTTQQSIPKYLNAGYHVVQQAAPLKKGLTRVVNSKTRQVYDVRPQDVSKYTKRGFAVAQKG